MNDAHRSLTVEIIHSLTLSPWPRPTARKIHIPQTDFIFIQAADQISKRVAIKWCALMALIWSAKKQIAAAIRPEREREDTSWSWCVLFPGDRDQTAQHPNTCSPHPYAAADSSKQLNAYFKLCYFFNVLFF
jgi:hypothetical protein